MFLSFYDSCGSAYGLIETETDILFKKNSAL